ncbi:HAD family hydrolase [Pandoraea apista]|uniref:HAD family hydrolase n=1 Tax=Pandoraea apista TaxID=93218 RepID=A0A5E5P185_9BURK|nr:HAD family phosphatase [Pandoraea apista]OXS90113.1 hypothetical protein B7H01_18620 [Pandoraea apista]VVG70055.1 HAD family hydrolase [Pandoraea apista]
MFSAAIFDMDGLLVDSERAIMNTWITVGLDLGIALSASDYLRIVGRSSTECELILTELLGGAATFREALARVRQHLSKPSVNPIFPLKSGARVGVLHFFKTIAGGDEVDRGKPDPAVYRLAAHRLGVPADACLAFEDSDNGAHAAASAGIAVVVVPDLKPPAAEVAELSFRILGKLDVAIEHVADWFTTRDTKFA